MKIPVNYEKQIIDPIVKIIKDNQDFLTQTENLPQLAKLGFIYNSLSRAGMCCWGYKGLLQEKGSSDDFYCDFSARDKIEMYDPKTGELDFLIYDAWAIHEFNENCDFDYVKNIVNGKTTISDLEKKRQKVDKTFDDWVDILLDPNYEYKSIFPNRKSVANHLLCVLGSGFDFNKDGYMVETIDGSIYGDWKNVDLSMEISKMINDIISLPIVETALNTASNHIKSVNVQEKEKEDKLMANLDEMKKLLGIKPSLKAEDTKSYRKYYPLSDISKINRISNGEKVHKSYILESIKVCKDILEHETEESEFNVKMARTFLSEVKI